MNESREMETTRTAARRARGSSGMKKAAIILGSLLVALTLILAGVIVYARLNTWGPADRTENINVLLTRTDHWEKIVDSPVITEEEMSLVDGSTATVPITAELLRQFFDHSDEKIRSHDAVFHSTTHDAYTLLIEKESKMGEGWPVSLILVTPPSGEEKQYAKDRGVELDMTPVAMDGFVFITHKDNPVESLTVEQVQGIYSGEITNWSQVGGEGRKIRAYQREPNSGSQTAMEQLVMEGREMVEPIDTMTTVAWGMGALVDAVAEYENGPASIGYTYNYYLNNLYLNADIKVIPIDGVLPTDENLIAGSYPFTTSYYAVIRGDEPEDSPARKLRDFLLTDLGQDVIAMAGYCKAVG